MAEQIQVDAGGHENDIACAKEALDAASKLVVDLTNERDAKHAVADKAHDDAVKAASVAKGVTEASK